MASDPRYALYFAPAPETALWQFGSAVLGYDAATGNDVPPLVPGGIDADAWRSWTEEPRRYGFHATLKAPFRLADGASESALVAAVADFAAARASFDLALDVSLLDGFIALTPAVSPLELAALERSVVTTFDRFRAPVDDAERARRLKSNLTPRQASALEQYGYPHVLDDFRFHMTLSTRLPAEPASSARAALQAAYAARCPSAVSIDQLAIFRQDEGRFRVLTRARFGGG